MIATSFWNNIVRNLFFVFWTILSIVTAYQLLSIGVLFFQKERIIRECGWGNSVICYFPLHNNEIDYIEKACAIEGVTSCVFLPIEYDFLVDTDSQNQALFLIDDLGDISDVYPLDICEGRYPKRGTNEVVINISSSEKYKIGDTVSLVNPLSQKKTQITIVGYILDDTVLLSSGSQPGKIVTYSRDKIERGIYLDGILSNSPRDIASSYYLDDNSTNVVCVGYDIAFDSGEYIKEQYLNPYFLVVNCENGEFVDGVVSNLKSVFGNEVEVKSVYDLVNEYRQDNSFAIRRFACYMLVIAIVFIIAICVTCYNRFVSKYEEVLSYYACGFSCFESVLFTLSGYYVSLCLGILSSLTFILYDFKLERFLIIVLGLLAINIVIALIAMYHFKRQIINAKYKY